MDIEEEILDNYIDEDDYEVVFTKPLYAQGWFISLIWTTIFGLSVLYVGLESENARTFEYIAIAFAMITVVKYINSIRKLAIVKGVVHVYTFNKHKPLRKIPFNNMTAVVEASEVYFIQKAKYTGGVNLRSVYWQGQWDDIKYQFAKNAAYVKRSPAAFSDSAAPMTAGLPMTPAGMRGGPTLFKAFPIFYEIVLFPYLLVCRLLFTKKKAS